jgi:hypothetical protein
MTHQSGEFTRRVGVIPSVAVFRASEGSRARLPCSIHAGFLAPLGEGAGASEWRTRTAISDGATAEMSDRLERHAFEAIIART